MEKGDTQSDEHEGARKQAPIEGLARVPHRVPITARGRAHASFLRTTTLGEARERHPHAEKPTKESKKGKDDSSEREDEVTAALASRLDQRRAADRQPNPFFTRHRLVLACRSPAEAQTFATHSLVPSLGLSVTLTKSKSQNPQIWPASWPLRMEKLRAPDAMAGTARAPHLITDAKRATIGVQCSALAPCI